MRTERNVMIAASKSRPECNASDRTPKLPVRTTKNVLRETNRRAEPTLNSAASFFSRPSSTWLIAIIARLDYLNSPHSPEHPALPSPKSDISSSSPVSRSCIIFITGACPPSKDNILSRWVPGDLQMIRCAFLSIVLSLLLAASGSVQAPASSPAGNVWNAISAPLMDPLKSAHAENIEIVRDRIHITLTDGTIQFVQPVNGATFGAAFRGKGHVIVDPPNPIDTQQLPLFIKQDNLVISFTEATFSFTDGLLDEVPKQVKWQASGGPA